MVNKLQKRSTGRASATSAALRAAMIRILDRRVMFKGDMLFPCVPVLADEFTGKLVSVWATLGRPISSTEAETLRNHMRTAVATGYRVSPNGAILVSWEANAYNTHVTYKAELVERSLEDKYGDWLKWREGPLFGALADAKIMSVASLLGDPGAAPVLDVGAGTGRNALALAAKGHPTDAIEVVPEFCKALRESAATASLPLRVFEADVLADELQLERSFYRLALASEVLTHFASADEARSLFGKLTDALAPGGLLVFNAFLGRDGYEPDRLARELGHTSFASVFSHEDLAFVVDELPFEQLSDESAFEFEKANSTPSAWPPTEWFESWSRGANLFDLPLGKAPIELRWLVYRRK